MRLKMFFLGLFLSIAVNLPARTLLSPLPFGTFAASSPSPWAEQQLKRMSLEEKIAQLLMIQVYSNASAKELRGVYETVRKYQPGGVCFFDGGPGRQIGVTNRLQKLSEIPMLVAIDGEWGLSMRLDSCVYFPRQMTLGALPVSDYGLIEQMGVAIGRQCRAVGVRVNFAPCVDVNCNPLNPVINSRSFGEDPEKVAAMSVALMRGMQSQGVGACAKHFPGHGDTQVDSHLDLPVINKSREQLEMMELYPFRKITSAGVDFVMAGHLCVPALDTSAHSISSLSSAIVTELLRNDLGYNGLVITDALGMKGVRNSHPHNGEAEVQALLAGVDILLMPSSLNIVISEIKSAVKKGIVTEELINERCLRILEYKSRMGLEHYEPLSLSGIQRAMNLEEDEALIDSIEAESHTMIRNSGDVVPLLRDESSPALLLCVGGQSDTAYYHHLACAHGMGFLQVSRTVKPKQYAELSQAMAPYGKVVVVMLNTSQVVKSHYGITDESQAFLHYALAGKKSVLALMANPYALGCFEHLEDFSSIVVGYTATKSAVESLLRCVCGERDFTGSLPVTVGGFAAGTSLRHPTAQVVEIETHPLFSNFSVLSDRTNFKIDSMVTRCINDRILPGCQILAMRNDELLFYRNYGKLTYEGIDSVSTETMYDVASMTKALATTLAVMKLYEEGKIRITDKVLKHLDYMKGTKVGNVSVAELMTHTTGLPPGILFYKKVMKGKQFDTTWVRAEADSLFSVEAAAGVYLRKDFVDTAMQMVAHCRMGEKKYIYSDLNFIILKEIVEHITGQGLDEYVAENVYRPLGLVRTGYHPLELVSDGNIAPTEYDTYFRMQQLQGYVHDPSAAVFGGVSGNAGLFSTAQEVSMILRMLMRGGELDGHRCFTEETVARFTQVWALHGCERRSLGFDMPSGKKPSTIIPSMASKRTYGHQGFTGTVFWCDPDSGLIYVFLSNRVCPDAEPNNLSKSRLRLLVHEEIYKGMNP